MKTLHILQRISIVFILLFCAITYSFAQDIDPSQINNFTAQQSLEEQSVDKFENSGMWQASISPDDGLATSRIFEGGPNEENGKVLIDQEPDEFVLGVRVDYFRRSETVIYVTPSNPIAIPGLTKTLSVWVAGRNYNHMLNVHLIDYNGRPYKLPVTTLNFSGWRQLSIAIPPSIAQAHPYYAERQGIQFAGFSIEPDLLETLGSYYVYFDDLRAFTDVYALNAGRNLNDPEDTW